MTLPVDLEAHIKTRADSDTEFRDRLLANPKTAIEQAFGITLDADHEIRISEETFESTHLVLPPRNKLTQEEREEAKTGVNSLEFLRKTMHDPAPPVRNVKLMRQKSELLGHSLAELVPIADASIDRALAFVDSTLNENGAWHCIRYNVAKPEVPRHFERPAFVSAYGVLALLRSNRELAKSICARTKSHLIDTMEYPGLWRYYRHLPQDFDSTTLCSLVLDTHPWIALRRNASLMLANRDEDGHFRTWLRTEDQPEVVPVFRIEADPVVNANVIAYLGDQPETKDAQEWLVSLLKEDKIEGTSKWYPDSIAIYYAISRAMTRVEPVLDHLKAILAERILGERDKEGSFGNILQLAQAVSALYNIGRLNEIDVHDHVFDLLVTQREDGSWPELLAFGDQTLKWGVFGQIAHASEALTTAFCVEALERLVGFIER